MKKYRNTLFILLITFFAQSIVLTQTNSNYSVSLYGKINFCNITLEEKIIFTPIGAGEMLFETLENTGEEIIGIRPGEKLNETLINSEEIRYSWEIDNMYMISNPEIMKTYPSAKKIENMEIYSSDRVDKIPKDQLKQLIKNLI